MVELPRLEEGDRAATVFVYSDPTFLQLERRKQQQFYTAAVSSGNSESW